MRFAQPVEIQTTSVAFPASVCVCAMGFVPGQMMSQGLVQSRFTDVYRYAWEMAQDQARREARRFVYQPSLN